MSTRATNQAGMYDAVGPYIAELYDRAETQRDDVALILSLLGRRSARILEPFCGHGRILLPLVEAGHQVTGLDLSQQMLDLLARRVDALPADVAARVSHRRCDVVAEPWPAGYEVVILGANCLYELASAQEQERCIAAAAASLVPGGRLYLDNNHMEGALDPSWRQTGVRQGFPSGECADGTKVESTTETIWFDAEARLARFRRASVVTTPDGTVHRREYTQQKHPPSTAEMSHWLATHGFVVESLWGDRHRAPYSDDAGRAIFWARKP